MLLIVGSGCLKGNISAQVGQLYPKDEESRRTSGFTIFSAAINIGAVLGPLACGAAAAIYGWHAGFALAAALMIVALFIYLSGQRHLPGKMPTTADSGEPLPPLTSVERRRTALLIVVIALTVLPNIAYPMIWNIGLIWIDANVSLASPFGTVPASWFNSIDSFFQHRDRAAAGRLVGVAGAARPRAERPRQDRHRVGSDRSLCIIPRRRFAVRGL